MGRKSLQVGSRVAIRVGLAHLRHRQNRNGRVTHIDGALIMVRPMWCSWEVELYPGELKVL